MFQIDKLPHFNLPKGTHGEGVNFGLKKVKTQYVLLVDSDVIFIKDYKPAFERFKESGCALMGSVVENEGGKNLYPRVDPCYCFIDLNQLKQHKIEFFDWERTLISKNTNRVYDIGSTMFEDCQTAGLIIGHASMEGKYFKHYGGMSWHCATYDPNQIDTDIDFGGTHPHAQLFVHGLRVKEQYKKETEYLNDICISSAFSYE
jgi:hypothetical protein